MQRAGQYTFSPDDSLGKGSFAEVFKGNRDDVGCAFSFFPLREGRPIYLRMLSHCSAVSPLVSSVPLRALPPPTSALRARVRFT